MEIRRAVPDDLDVVVDASVIAFVDVTAVRTLGEHLARDSQHVAFAHDIGRVGDLPAAEAITDPGVFTIDEHGLGTNPDLER